MLVPSAIHHFAVILDGRASHQNHIPPAPDQILPYRLMIVGSGFKARNGALVPKQLKIRIGELKKRGLANYEE